MFIGREKELTKLNNMYVSGKFEFAVIYGRRRVGKTTLINQFCKDKKTIYFSSIESTLKENLKLLSKSYSSYKYNDNDDNFFLTPWLKHLKKYLRKLKKRE